SQIGKANENNIDTPYQSQIGKANENNIDTPYQSQIGKANENNIDTPYQSQIGKANENNIDTPYQMISGLFIAGVAMLVTGFCWDMVFPINKKIWTSSYTIYTSGLATITIATMIYMIELKKVKGALAKFFDVFGKNPLFVFALSAFLPKGFALIQWGEGLNPWNWLYKKVLIYTPGLPQNGSLLYALCVITFMWAICYWLDKKKIYIKV
ncbi:MAG: hypothetical protein ACM3H8_13345, partial [Sphingobacteriales bacterium]